MSSCSSSFPPTKYSAFSLVELAIVLVIIGLIIGGVIVGQSLIRQAELRAVNNEYSRYVTAVYAFRNKYAGIPGDMAKATTFWGHSGGTNCFNNSGTTDTTPGTCDGDGSGFLRDAFGASQTAEFAQFWRQLALAGLIEGNYSGMAGSGGIGHCVIGTDCPRSKINNAGWGTRYQPSYGGDGYNYAFDYGTSFRIGGQNVTSVPGAPVFRPEEALNIDTKIDDDSPATGKVIAAGWNDCTTSANNADYTGRYALTNNQVVCALWFAKIF